MGRRNDDAVRVSEELTGGVFVFEGLREELKMLGGRWDGKGKIWRIACGLIRGTALEERMQLPPAIKMKV